MGIIVYTAHIGWVWVQTFAKTVRGQFDKVPLESVSKEARELVLGLLELDTKKRLTCKGVLGLVGSLVQMY